MALQWGYKRAFLRCLLLFVVGVVLQCVVGDFDNGFLRYPWGLILAVNYLYLLILLHFQRDKWRWVNRLSDHYASVSALGSMVLITIIFGLTRQDTSTEGVVGLLGFSRMTSSWPFNLLLFYFTTTIGLSVVDDLHHWRQRKLAAMMSHVAVFVVLTCGMFGSADKMRITVNAHLERPVAEGVDANGVSHALPFAITLKEFVMEEYPPKLYLLDTCSETSSQEFLSVDDASVEGEIEGWYLKVERMYDMAGRMPESSEWRDMLHTGAAPAVYLSATNSATGESYVGWVSCGSHIFEPSYLFLGERYAIAMPRRDAKRYLSRVDVEQMSGERARFDIEVNHPARIGAWRIYQVGYDTARGRWSSVSVLECVKDGWYSAINIALWLMLAAGVVMFITAGGRSLVRRGAAEPKEKLSNSKDKEVKL
ncbi:MAG: cytochrome c biogenesis protein ResB [Alistipes sp.]|nr:cytochrome c biogenesis protein ResB [Alistipes sp.]